MAYLRFLWSTFKFNSKSLGTAKQKVWFLLFQIRKLYCSGWFQQGIDKHSHRRILVGVNFKSLIKDPTCFKNPEKHSTIDLILSNHPRCFHSGDYETGLPDFHRDYKNFTNEHLRRDLLLELSFQNVQPNEFDKFNFIASKLWNSHAQLKEK